MEKSEGEREKDADKGERERKRETCDFKPSAFCINRTQENISSCSLAYI